jgi:BirA family biotin operon repressor/biotin-[acetyl-CoA-carboxylase] ligase
METLFIGKNTHFLTQVESTNTYAMDLLRNVNVLDGTVIYAENQTKGKGQRGAEWIVESGKNLTISVVLKPNFINSNDSFYLSKITALATYDVLADLVKNSHNDIKIKWPNDILVDSKKVAGILIENTYLKSLIQYTIIGVGININQVIFDQFNTKATSLKLINETTSDFDKKQILLLLCSYLEKWYLKLKEFKFEEINSAFMKNLYGIHENKLFHHNVTNENFEACIIGVMPDGKLHLKNKKEENMFFEVKEISLIL